MHDCCCRRKVLHGWRKNAKRRRFLSQCARSIWQRNEALVRGQCWAVWRSRSITSRRRRGVVSHCLARLQKCTVHGAFARWSESAARQARSCYSSITALPTNTFLLTSSSTALSACGMSQWQTKAGGQRVQAPAAMPASNPVS